MTPQLNQVFLISHLHIEPKLESCHQREAHQDDDAEAPPLRSTTDLMDVDLDHADDPEQQGEAGDDHHPLVQPLVEPIVDPPVGEEERDHRTDARDNRQ